jgi:hypothetical protein
VQFLTASTVPEVVAHALQTVICAKIIIAPHVDMAMASTLTEVAANAL